MFRRLSSKLLNPASNKKKKQLTRASGNENTSAAAVEAWVDIEDDESLDSYSTAHAVSLFPVDADPQLDYASTSSWGSTASKSYSENNDQKSWLTSSSEINIGPPFLMDYEEAEEAFLDEYHSYFENLSVDNIRREQYPSLDLQRVVHLDYATRPIFSRTQVEDHMQLLLEGSSNSIRSSEILDRILGGLFKTNRNEYLVVLTTGLSSSYRLVAEVSRVDRNTQLVMCGDVHESARNIVRSGARARIVGLRDTDLCIREGELKRLMHRASGKGLVVAPAQSSLSGSQHPFEEWIEECHAHRGWHFVLEVTTVLPACGALDLSSASPDFVVGSLTQVLGYPQGVGFLLVKKSFQRQLHKYNLVDVDGTHVACDDNGTVDRTTLEVVALGLEHLQDVVGLERINKRVTCLVSWLRTAMNKMRHDEKRAMIRLYGKNQGSVLVFNLIDSTGNVFPADIVQKLAMRQNMRVGMCELCKNHLLLQSSSKTLAAFKAVTVSLGCMSTFQDVYRFAHFLLRFRDEEYMSAEAMGYIEESLT